MKKKLVFLLTFLLAIISYLLFTKSTYDEKQKLEEFNYRNNYNEYVVTNENIKLYKKQTNDFIEIGSVTNNQLLYLDAFDENIKYYKLKNTDLYIGYNNLTKSENVKDDKRFNNYIPYDFNVKGENINLYNQDNEIAFTIENINIPLLIKYDEYYGIIFNDQLFKVKKDDVELVDSNNNSSNVDSIAVLNYHFFYGDEEVDHDCHQNICISTSKLKEQLDYIKENNIFTPNMNEFEMYINGNINLPKSVLITIDDGWRMYKGIDLMEEYGINATVFLITSWFNSVPITFLHDYKYIEFHSHGDNLHNGGVCSGGQGGAIKCLEKAKLLADLKLSREKLEGSTVFCYPFYEYNSYSINMLKEAGFTLAFRGGSKRAKVNESRYEIPRYEIFSSTSLQSIKNYIG